jgi:GTP pyrophosphokinase
MQDKLIKHLKSISIANYLVIVNSLKCIPRRIGGNQMRHSLAVFGICLDYEIYDPICLKLALCHDLLEDHPQKNEKYDEIKKQIYDADEDGPLVLEGVEEITIRNYETKEEYLQRLISSKYDRVKIIKGADRISNFTDLNTDFTNIEKIRITCEQTNEIIIPMLQSVKMFEYHAENMIIELTDLIYNRMEIIKNFQKNLS